MVKYGWISTPGIGSRFTISLSYERTSRVASGGMDTAGTPERFTEKVVIIDDDPYIVQLVSSILSKQNISHASFTSAENFLQHEWDVIQNCYSLISGCPA